MSKISIIVPIYNAARFLETTVNSILKQRYTNWELLLIDDCSIDESPNICCDYQRKDSRILFLKNKRNIGAAATRNEGIKRASGKYVVFIDSDDVVESNYLERLYQTIEKYHVDIVWCNYKECFPNGVILNKSHNLPICQKLTSRYLLELYFSGTADGLGSMWNKIYSLDFLRGNKILLDERMAIGEDWNFNLDAFQKQVSLIAINDCLYNYIRQNQTSIMNSFHENHFDLMCEMRYKLLRLAREKNILYDKEKFWGNFIYNSLVFLHKAAKHGKSKNYLKTICKHELFKRSLKEVKSVSISPFYNLVFFFLRKRLFTIAFFILRYK